MNATPHGCRHCGVDQRSHGQRWSDAVDWHEWTAPDQAQIKARMLARQAERDAAARYSPDEVARAAAVWLDTLDEVLAARITANADRDVLTVTLTPLDGGPPETFTATLTRQET